ncbi:MAG: glycerol-3-phosphate dehydrogenase/oxidase, partial [Actinomycetota bacterium]
MESYDLLVIGGGINGLGIAADASARGLSVLLVEKRDFGSGTSAASSRLIHGGLRYLQYGELSLVRESLRERGLLVRQRPHLVRPIQLLIPAYAGVGPPAWKLRAGLALYDLLARDPAFPRSQSLSATGVSAREPGLSRGDLCGGFVYPDAQIEFPERLCVELVRETLAAGGEAINYTRVTGLRQEGSRVVGAALRDEFTGREWDVEARLTINAAGPWVDAVNALLHRAPPRLIGGTWGSHVVLPSRPNGPRGHLYATAAKDDRPFFILPWDNRLLVGTTDVPFQGNPDELEVKDWEVEYLLAETNRLFPGCGYSEADVQHTTIGVRP